MFKKILNLLFPTECLGCEQTGSYICDQCLAAIPLRDNCRCLFCGREVIAGKICTECSSDSPLERVLAATSYDDLLVKNLIQTCKYKGVKDVSQALAKILDKFLTANNLIGVLRLEEAVLVPIPLHKKRLAERGFNQSQETACHLAKKINLKTLPLLGRAHWKGIQKDSAKDERKENIAGAFEFAGHQIPQVVILLDDVVTSGSTLSEAAKELKKAGVKRIIGLAVAHED